MPTKKHKHKNATSSRLFVAIVVVSFVCLAVVIGDYNHRVKKYSKAACTLAENQPKLGDFLIGRSFSGVSFFSRFANQQKNPPKLSLLLIKNWLKQPIRTVHKF